jgi:hypothetical protein
MADARRPHDAGRDDLGLLAQAGGREAGRNTSDIDENAVRELGLAAGVVDVKVCAIDEVWSGLKFVRRLADRVEC